METTSNQQNGLQTIITKKKGVPWQEYLIQGPWLNNWKRRMLSFDQGRKGFKAIDDKGRLIYMPSYAFKTKQRPSMISDRDIVIQFEGEEGYWIVGEKAKQENKHSRVNFDGKASEATRALTLGMITRFGYQNRSFPYVFGLPYDEYADEAKTSQRALTELLQRDHAFKLHTKDGTQEFNLTLDKPIFTFEGGGAFFAYRKLKLYPDHVRYVYLIEIGARTVNLIAVEIINGIPSLIDTQSDTMSDGFDTLGEQDPDAFAYNIYQLCNQRNWHFSHLNSDREQAVAMVAGGGSYGMYEPLKKYFPRLILPNDLDPLFANVVGFMEIGQAQVRARGKKKKKASNQEG
ncbi:hypothetical protein GCM10011571_32870 [Marinithermofilum abyssi]|uniref:Actin-like protein N-terminal domain-containing protein n=1 Tax=Marinithermofilum abyssi TaxID=1571185 RepID=A0A8J2YF76_9BACL|nr:hypothetical protein [Marinithermofilum abyssi]GGE28186.1 hypothetical protein GCM10011571_32870 [Marinithermofilum abyssi]